MHTKRLLTIALILIGSFFLSTFVLAQPYSRNITAEFNDIQIKVDYWTVAGDKEPFLYNNEVYVSASDLADALFLELEYAESDKVLHFRTNSTLSNNGINPSIDLLFQKDLKIASLTNQINEVEAKLDFAHKRSRSHFDGFPYLRLTTRSEMRDYLREYFIELEDIPMNISLVQSSTDRYRLNITFPSGYRSDFENVSRVAIEDWLDEVFYAIRNWYNPNAQISGYIRDSRFRNFTKYVEFETEDNNLEFDFNHDAHKTGFQEAETNAYPFLASSRLLYQDNIIFNIYAVSNQTYSRTLTVWFDNISVAVDEAVIYMINPPIIYNGHIYVPISDMADALYFKYKYDPENSVLNIGSLLYIDAPQSYNSRLVQKDLEIFFLANRLKELEKEYSIVSEVRLPYREISTASQMQSYLRVYFGRLEDLSMNIGFSHRRGNNYNLNITFPNSFINRQSFELIDRREIETWIDEMFYAIKELYDPNAKVRGYIKDSRSRSYITFVEFETRDNFLAYDFKRTAHRANQPVHSHYLEDLLHDKLRRYNNINFYYNVFINRKDIDLVVQFNNDHFYNWNLHRKINFLHRLNSELPLNINANGMLIDTAKEENVLRFSFEDGLIRSYDLLDETEDYLKKYYGSYSWRPLNFNYYITEIDTNTFKVKIEGDFPLTSSDWKDVENNYMDSFNQFIEHALSNVQHMWRVNIVGEVVDQNLEQLTTINLNI